MSHGNVTNALLLEPANLGITLGSKVAQVLNIAFDMGMDLDLYISCQLLILACRRLGNSSLSHEWRYAAP